MIRSVCLLLLSIAAYASPPWYHNLATDRSSYYIGYGQGGSEAEAKRNALDDIAAQIAVEVESTHASEMGEEDGDSYRNVKELSSQRAKAQLHDYEVMRLAHDEGIYYIAVGYENIPAIDRFNRELSKLPVTKAEVQNRYLAQTPVADALSKKVDFSLKRKDGLWYIHYRSIMQPLDDKAFLHFFASTANPALKLELDREDSLYENDEFYFHLTSDKSGYVTLFTVYENGTVAVLMHNVPVKKNEREPLPNSEHGDALQAGLIHAGRETFDLYVAIYSESKRHYDQFARADEALIEDERYKNFDELITLLDKEEFVTLKVVTKPRR